MNRKNRFLIVSSLAIFIGLISVICILNTKLKDLRETRIDVFRLEQSVTPRSRLFDDNYLECDLTVKNLRAIRDDIVNFHIVTNMTQHSPSKTDFYDDISAICGYAGSYIECLDEIEDRLLSGELTQEDRKNFNVIFTNFRDLYKKMYDNLKKGRRVDIESAFRELKDQFFLGGIGNP